MSQPSVPRRAELILEALGADADFRDAVLGDLAEEYALRESWDGRSVARRWYYRESVRVAPYLLRDWRRRLKWKDVAYLGGVVAGSTVFLTLFERLIIFVVFSLTSIDEQMFPLTGLRPIVVPAFMLVWTLFDGVVGGYVAARIGRRAPLPGAIAMGLTWAVLILLGHPAPFWFRCMNATIWLTGIVAGGLTAVSRTTAQRAAGAID